MFAQMFGSKAERPTPWYPSGGPGPPLTGRYETSLGYVQCHYGGYDLKGQTWASEAA